MKADKIWMDGKFVDWDKAKVHVLTHALHYGSGVFEGIRAYKTEQGTAIFRLTEHVDRLFNSAKILKLELSYSKEEISQAIKETVRVNRLESCYIRPLIYRGYRKLGLNPFSCPVQFMVAAWEWGAYLGEEALAKGIKAIISSWQRSHINSTSAKAKLCANYINSIFANMEATELGVDEAILLDSNGYVAEGPGENIFWIKDGIIFTPPLTSVLDGITRNTVMTITRDMGYEVREELVARDVLYIADEAFFVGSAAELTPIREIDRYILGSGDRGPISKKIQEKLFNVFKGKERKYLQWLDFV
ncbi:MAG: branched-chain amino acid transaminase [Atribacterota bacterium]|nr:branched-chain amino acid transaminase [Atribacterota bacterium]MDD4895981.1 branched-chain amino acid transaminase [Atribacterota bacterium]MDD5638198.1 branched-chain amino acid transaminase [Atribacterota bacterium]